MKDNSLYVLEKGVLDGNLIILQLCNYLMYFYAFTAENHKGAHIPM